MAFSTNMHMQGRREKTSNSAFDLVLTKTPIIYNEERKLKQIFTGQRKMVKYFLNFKKLN